VKKISHRQLEDCRHSPKAWALNQKTSAGFSTFGYRQALSNAITLFHRLGDPVEANKRLEEFIDRHFTDLKKINVLRNQLIEYTRWYVQTGIITADSNVTLNFPIHSLWHLGGKVARVDVTDSGYRAILFEEFDGTWKEQLRMPLIQLAIAEKFGRPPAEVRVGFQDLDGNKTVEASYGEAKRSSALAEFESIGAVVQSILPPK
jgi:hypothetical protein